MALTPGTRLGHYEIVASLGAGGMGEVYRARDPRLEREVAVKVLPEHLADDPAACARFEREARAVAALSHPNILAIFDVGEENGVHFVVMELLEGKTLEGTLADEHMSWQRVLDIGIAVASGMEAAHAKGIFHRDIKPANLFITSAGSIKILDFGLARMDSPNTASDSPEDETVALETAITQPGMIMGTIQYLSPEQVRGRPADARSDIFALGAVLYEAMTGSKPFRGTSAVETMASILRETPPPIESNAPPELHDVIGHCLEKDPTKRFQTATDLAMSLRALRGATTFMQHTAPAAATAHRHTSAWIAWSVLAANVVMAALVGFNVGGMRDWLFGHKGPQRIAVLPLELMNPQDPEDDRIWADALTQSLINTVGQIDGLRVISPYSVRNYAGPIRGNDALRSIAKELNVDWIVHGSIQRADDEVIILAHLVDARSGEQHWGGEISGDSNNLLGLQRNAAQKFAEKISIELSPVDQKQLAADTRYDPEAYHLYLKGLYYTEQRDRASLERAVDLFSQAINIDPTLAQAHALLADTYVTMTFYGYMTPTEAMAKANQPLNAAMRHDPVPEEAYLAEGSIKYALDQDLVGAEKSFRKAIRLNPSYFAARFRHALVLSSLNRHEEAMKEAKESLGLNPRYPMAINTYAMSCLAAKRYKETVDYCKGIYDKPPAIRLILGRAYVQLGEYDLAIEQFDEAIAESAEKDSDLNQFLYRAFRGHALALAGRREEATAILDELKSRYDAGTAAIDPYEIAMIYVGLGENEDALKWLKRAKRERSPHVNGLKFEAMFDPLRGDPAFQRLIGDEDDNGQVEDSVPSS